MGESGNEVMHVPNTRGRKCLGAYITLTCSLFLETRVGYRVGQEFVSRNASRNMRGRVQGEVQLLPRVSCWIEAKIFTN